MSLPQRIVPLLLALGSALPLSAGELRGRLFFGDGKPARGVTVSALPYETPHETALREARRGTEPAALAEAASAADGRFVLSVPRPEAKFVVSVHGGGAVGLLVDGVFEGSESEELPDLALAKAEQLSGKVVDAAGVPLEGAEVTLLVSLDSPLPARARTGPDGIFRFADADAAATGNVLSVAKEGYAPARRTGIRSGALALPVVLGPGVPLAGSVQRPDRKGPAKKALVRWEGAAATSWAESDEEGRFSLAHVPAGKGTLIADGGDVGWAEVAHLSLPLASEKPLVVTLGAPAVLEGRVVDAKTGRAVPRVKLVAKGSAGARVTRSGPDGRYRFAPIPAERLHLRADEPRYVAWEKDGVAPKRGETKTQDVALVAGATIAGRVVDENGAPVGDAKGSLEKAGQSGLALLMRRARGGGASPAAFRSAADGSFRASRLAPGDGQKLVVVHPDFETGTVAGLSLPAGGAKPGVTVVLRRGTALTGLVHDKDGNPVAGAEVALRQEGMLRGGRRGAMAMINVMGGGDRPSATTGPDGRFALAGVPAGEWAVVVQKRGFGTERVAPVKVGDEKPPVPLDVTLGPAASLSGVVRGKSGAPLEGWFVSARATGAPMGGGAAPQDPTGPDGAFSVDGLKAGQTYDVVSFGGNGPGPQKSGVVAPAEGLELVATGTGRITGRAMDEKTSRPLTDFVVSVEPDNAGGRFLRMAVRAAGRRARGFAPSEAVQAEDGAFALENVPAGTWSVVVEAKGYQTARVGGVVVEEAATKENVEVRASPGGALTGRVLDARSGRGVPEVNVAAGPAAGGGGMGILMALDDAGGVTTDADGKFAVEGLAPGRYKVSARHADYAEATETVEVKESGGNVDLQLTAGSVLGGVVLSESRQPVGGAEVALSEEGEGGFGPRGFGFGQSATTDSSGRFRFEHLTAGRYSLTASLRSHTSQPASAVLTAGESKEDVALTLAAGITVRGSVTGLPDAQRAGVNVTGSGPESWFASTRTSGDGTFELTGAPAGALLLRATAGDFFSSSRTASKQVVATDAQPVLEVEIAFEEGHTLSGRVTKAGQAVAGASVNATLLGGGGRSGSARADDGGAYRIEGLQPGRYSVMVFGGFSGGPSKSQTVDLSGDQTLDVDFPTARLSGTVVESGSRRPLADASVEVAGGDGPSFRRTYSTDSNGRFSVADLEAKSYTLTVQKTDFLFEKRDVAASEQGTDDLVIELTRGQGIGIEVKDGIYGIPLKGVFVRATDSAKRVVFGGTVSLDSEGRGEVPSLQPGVYALWLDADGYAPASLPSVSVPARTVPVLMTPGGTVEIHAGSKTLASGSARLQFLTATGAPYQMGPFSEAGVITLSLPIRRIENFAPGSYTLQVTGGESKAFAVQEGQTTVVTLP